MNPLETMELGSTGLKVTRIGLGGAPMGGLFSEVSSENAFSILETAYESGIKYFDTAPLYGSGKSESYYGTYLPYVPRNQFVISTKVGRVLKEADRSPCDAVYVNLPEVQVHFDYSRDGILRSIEDSLRRLKLDKIDIALVHDPDDHYEQALKEALPTLYDLRSEGVITAIGAGMNQWEMMGLFAREADCDCFLLAGRYTLLDYSALYEFLPLCESKGISVILGGPFNSGILASDLRSPTTYFYQDASENIIEKAKRIKNICDLYSVNLKAAALQFGLMHPAVVSTIPGARTSKEVVENINMIGVDIPSAVWDNLKSEKLIPSNAPTN